MVNLWYWAYTKMIKIWKRGGIWNSGICEEFERSPFSPKSSVWTTFKKMDDFREKRLSLKSRPFREESSILGKIRQLISKWTCFQFSLRNHTYFSVFGQILPTWTTFISRPLGQELSNFDDSCMIRQLFEKGLVSWKSSWSMLKNMCVV
jgi:hypothetical protein